MSHLRLNNSVSNKPYTEKYEGTVDERDEEIAAEELRRHRMRNDSFLTDAMEGFFKNKLVCPVSIMVIPAGLFRVVDEGAG